MSKKIIGIIAVPLSPGRKYFKVCGDGYIASSHIDWLERAGLEVLAIPYNTKKHKYYFDRINGLYLPSGGVFASNSIEYYNCCKKFIQMAINSYDLKGDYFPIWGGCMGMQQMMMVSEGTDNQNLLQRFDSFNNLMLPLILTKEGIKGRMMNYVMKHDSNTLNDFIYKESTLNNHMMGLSPKKFKNCGLLNSVYKIVSWNYDRKGKKFVSTIEGRKYPFYGVQWHPERSKDADVLARFLNSEIEKNNHTKKIPLKKKMQYKKVDCMNYSDQIYNYCNFYWFEKTSEHNRNLCNVLNLGKPTNNAV